jgi:hypothetical protein
MLADRLPSLGRIDEHAWNVLKQELAPISDSYLRSLLIETGLPLSPLIEGVHTSDLNQAERTLRALAVEYESADPERRKIYRRVVIEAKQRARWWLRRSASLDPPETPLKEEVLLWTSTWLENPLLFQQWVSLRKQQFPTEGRMTQP